MSKQKIHSASIKFRKNCRTRGTEVAGPYLYNPTPRYNGHFQMPFLCNKKSCTDHWQSGHIFLYFYYWAFMKSSLRRKQVDPARLLVPLHGAGTARGSKASRFYPRKPIGGVGHLYPGHPTLRFPLVVAAGWECNAFRRKIGKEVSTLVSWNGHAGELSVHNRKCAAQTPNAWA